MAFIQLLLGGLTLFFAVPCQAQRCPVPARKQNSLKSVFFCENDLVYFSCSSYPGFINIINVEYTEKNTYVCNNHKKDSVHKKDLCKATQDEKDCLACVFMRGCDGKVNCNLHVAHDTYNGINLPCRNLSMDIRIEVIYDCIKYKDGLTPTECSSAPPLTAMTKTPTPTPTTLRTTTRKSSKKWKRRPPMTCNFTKEDHYRGEFESNTSCHRSSVLLVVLLFSCHCFTGMLHWLFNG